VQRCQDEWAASHDVNLGGTVRLFEAARDSGNLPVIYASSAAAYGDLGAVRLSEDMAPAPISAYGADKYGCELQAVAGGRAFGLPTAGLRFFNVFGPGQDPASPYSGAVSVFADRLRQGRLSMFRDGAQTRDYVFVATWCAP
jgi:UDP-glucose 4-epimerase